MVKFNYQPWEEINIHEIVEYPLEYFFTKATLGIPEGGVGLPLAWSNGIIYSIQPIQPTEDVVKEQLKGIIHWSALHYARMPKFQNEIIRAGQIRVIIMNMSNHTVFGPMANWIKENFLK
jgi:hypothetical protein